MYLTFKGFTFYFYPTLYSSIFFVAICAPTFCTRFPPELKNVFLETMVSFDFDISAEVKISFIPFRDRSTLSPFSLEKLKKC
ncbi:hypothetical protein [Clostridium folliculivorans]|uniref:hypothetical protein n=1 Tax=Clostridium folliculivorans TaxID=2886038 RepID=UPI0021C4BAD7|nr:hypothetical protein [Clostridium folliculivorans]